MSFDKPSFALASPTFPGAVPLEAHDLTSSLPSQPVPGCHSLDKHNSSNNNNDSTSTNKAVATAMATAMAIAKQKQLEQ